MYLFFNRWLSINLYNVFILQYHHRKLSKAEVGIYRCYCERINICFLLLESKTLSSAFCTRFTSVHLYLLHSTTSGVLCCCLDIAKALVFCHTTLFYTCSHRLIDTSRSLLFPRTFFPRIFTSRFSCNLWLICVLLSCIVARVKLNLYLLLQRRDEWCMTVFMNKLSLTKVILVW